ncbi:MAG: methyltransferase [Rhodobacteraceae bacterium]|jgi:SAM-dependent methyltransferase|nr:methyltransferase [Paracoccaceae bacterium]
MGEPSRLTEVAAAGLAELANGPPDRRRLEGALRHLAKWRSAILQNTVVAKTGHLVQGGPFAGMDYGVPPAEGAGAARLLGAYEAGLHPVIETIIARGYGQIVDIGCAEGYYAVGLARRMPQARVLARDISLRAQTLCATLAARNGVAARVEVGGILTHADFARCAEVQTAVICDIEGAEDDLLDPAAAPDLLRADILVECHDGFRPGVTARLAARFAATHRITRIDRVLAADLLPDWAGALSDLDRLLLLWEWRATPTPWLWMDRR